jgi:hypothetical protein
VRSEKKHDLVAGPSQRADQPEQIRFRSAGRGIAAAHETDFHFRFIISDFRLKS